MFAVAGILIATGAQADSRVAEYIVVLKPGPDRATAVEQARSLGGEVFMEYSHALNGFALRLGADHLDWRTLGYLFRQGREVS